jgi:hypothetical protein
MVALESVSPYVRSELACGNLLVEGIVTVIIHIILLQI